MEDLGSHPFPSFASSVVGARWLPWAAPTIGALVALVGAGHLAAWLSGTMATRGAIAITMKTNTALAILLLGAALVLVAGPGAGTFRRRAGLVCAGLAWLLGLLALGENLFGWNLGIDQFLATEAPGALGMDFPNRMGTPAAFAFVLAGPALVLLDRGRRRALAWAQGLALGCCLVSLLPLMGYLYEVPWLFDVARVTAIAWPTALCILGLGLGLLLARSGEGIAAQVAGRDAGGTILRRLLPPVVLLPIALGWLRVAGERAGWYGAAMGTALIMLTFIITLSALTWLAARQASRIASQLAEQKEFLRVTLTSIGDAVLACDGQERVSFINPTAAALAGWSQGEAQGQPIRAVFRIINERTGLEAEDIIRRVLDEGGVVGLANHTALVNRQGQLVPIEDSAAPIRGADGRIDGVVLVFHDVTEKRRAQEALRESEARYRALVELAPDALFVHHDRRILLANPAAARLLGAATPDALLGVDILDLVHPQDRTAASERIRTVQAGGRTPLTELRMLHRDGQSIPSEAVGAGLTFQGLPCVQVIVRDGRERKAAEEERERLVQALQEADRNKNEFLAVLSHELRNPLAPINNSLYILNRVDLDSGEAEQARRIMSRQVAQLTGLVSDLLDVTRITRGKVRLHKERFALDEVVRRTVEDHRTLFSQAGVGLEVVSTCGPLPVLADRTRIVQVLGNLLHNALKFTRQGGRALVSAAAEGDAAVVRVIDDGLGMDAVTLGTLFQPFMQAAQTLDRSRGGLGLGLALVKGLVDLHGGAVSAHSPGPGLGSELVVRLPLAPAERPQPAPASAAPVQGCRRILVIEDNADAAESLQAVLCSQGHEVATAGDGPQGLDLALTFEPEVVLSDIGLPGMSGYDVARAFRADPRLWEVFLVALSGYAQDEDLRRACEAGFQRHLAKPPNLDQLARILAEVPCREKLSPSALPTSPVIPAGICPAPR